MAKSGSLSINSENIFPIIKKWLYSDHDIFYRELVSNGCDAITKLKKLALMGEYETPDDETYKVQVTVNPKEKTIRIEDNGLGMTEDEVDEYINQIAFSGAQDFLNKYKDKANEDQIIGHFGLGFYSAFMVADKVTIDTLSYKPDAKPVHWESEGGTEFDMKEGTKEGHGTVITLYLNEDSAEFANEYRAREILDKYCAFMPVEIYLNDETAEPQYDTIEKDELTDKDTVIETIVEPAKTEEKEKEDVPNFESFVIEDENSIVLLNFVKKVIKSSLKLDNFTVMVLDGKRASSSFAAYGIKLTREYVVIISADGIDEYCSKLTRFTNHDVKAVLPSTIFWEEGKELVVEDDSSFSVVEEHQSKELSNTNSNVSFRKSKTILPHWLDKKIFNDHRAIYAPEHERYEYNLDLNEEELKVYLGTYFPRSYAEMFCVVDNLMQNKHLKEMLERDKINVLDCGCGTGGEILGFITAIGKHLTHAKINITAIDGNDGALVILKDLIESNPNKKVQVELSILNQTLNNGEDVENLAFGEKNFHFILCDKIVCELISKEVLPINAYAIMAKKLATYLHENGLLIMLDVTTKDEHSGYFYPQLMNSSINDYVRESRTIETLLPLSCACYYECRDLCFMQQTFSVSHSHKSNDESRVCYRVLCRKPLKTTIMQEIEIENFAHVIHPTKYKQNDDSAICSRSKNNKITIDSFNINL